VSTQESTFRSGPLVSTEVAREPLSVAAQIRAVRLGIGIVDALVLVTAVLAAWQLRLEVGLSLTPSDPSLSLAANAGPEIIVAWLVVLFSRGAYSSRVFGAGTDEYRSVVMASLGTAGLVGLFCYLVSLDLSRGFVLLTFVMGTPALLAWRYVARQLVHRARARGHLVHRVIAVGAPSGVAEIVAILEREKNLGYEVIGACMPEGMFPEENELSVPVVGTVGTTRNACSTLSADTVLVAQGGFQTSADLRRVAWDLQGSDIELIVVPSLTDVAGPRIHMRPVAGLPLLHLQEPQVDEASGLSKRIFDFLGALSAIVLLAPLMGAVALAIKLEDGGPVFFRQRRVGRDGQGFSCLKFRSMVLDAEKQERLLREADGHEGALWKSKTDPRITRVGTFIRRYSLDELPQFFNVFNGQMSLVGPRPQQAWEVETYSASTKRRLLVRPGMTGLWQVSGRSELSLEDAVRLDLYYVDNWSLTTDLVIMAKTAKAVVSASGAY
jgi:exopolysaccharide biosynthesis polyprenyl glycosylphosphotransferase